MTALKKWLEAATTTEAALLAEKAGTHRLYLYQLAVPDHPDYGRHCRPDLAGRLAAASEYLHKLNPDLPVLKRGDLSDTCAACAYAQRCET